MHPYVYRYRFLTPVLSKKFYPRPTELVPGPLGSSVPTVSTGLEHLVRSVPWASIDANQAAGIVESLELVSYVHLGNREL